MTRKLKRELFNLARESDLAGWRFLIRMVLRRVVKGTKPICCLHWKTHPRHRIHEQPLNVLSALGAFGAGWADDLLVGMSWRSLRRSWEPLRPLGRRF